MQEVYKELNQEYSQISTDIKNGTNKDKIEALKKSYKAKSDEELLMALKPHPISVTLAQAAMESSWGTSRFFKEANNLFGVWSFNKNEPRIAASGQRGNKTIWLKKYATVKESVTDYYKNLGRSFAFKEFRQEKMISNNPYVLVTKLDRYSEKGAKYGEELTSMMSFNKFLNYDDIFFERPPKIEVVQAPVILEEKIALNTTNSELEKPLIQTQEIKLSDNNDIAENVHVEKTLASDAKINITNEVSKATQTKELNETIKDIKKTEEINKEKES